MGYGKRRKSRFNCPGTIREQENKRFNAINKQITSDILRQEKKNFCLITLDAKACYDRIAQPIASLALKRQGASSNMIKAMFHTIGKMKRCIRTSFGDSTMFYHLLYGL
jgi:hypothetical protein